MASKSSSEQETIARLKRELERANQRADCYSARLRKYRKENMDLRLRALGFFQQRRELRKALRAATGSGYV